MRTVDVAMAFLLASVVGIPEQGLALAQGAAELQQRDGEPVPGDRTILPAVRVATPPTIDGLISDGEWTAAAVARDFVQFEPQRGAQPSQPTTAWVQYDEVALYVAFRVAEPDEPIAELTRRDADLFEDDVVVVVLDSFLDRQSGYYFMTNLLGTQTDGRIVNDGRTTDPTWDGAWQVAAQRSSTSWSAELAIPFASIKYASGEGVSWGINLMRGRRRSLEISSWAGPLETRFRLSQAGTLEQLNVAAPESQFQIVPYGQSTVADGRQPSWRVGVDGRYEISSSTSAFATVNPDFALIEADRERVNLTRFELSVPEKRQFFLVGNEQFRQRIQTFYSRRIADIDAGAKIVGKQGAWTYHTLYARAQSSDGSVDSNFGVVRAQRDLGRSNVGLIGAARDVSGDSRSSVGLDTTLFFSDHWGMTAQIAQSFGEFDSGTLAYFLRPAYDTPTMHAHVRFSCFGEHFGDNVNAVGFVRDDNRRELDSEFEKTFWLSSGPIERVEYSSNYNVFWAADSTELRAWEVKQSVEVDFRNRFSVEVGHIEDLQVFEDRFRNRQTSFEIGYNTRAFDQVRAGYQFGRNFGADFELWTAAAGYKLTDQLSAEYQLQRLSLDPDPDGESTWIHVLRADQFFTPDLFINTFL